MYLEHFGLNEHPFRITPHTEFFFSGANRGATLDALLYAITHDEGIVKVTGEVGSGKTMLCRVLLERLPSNVVSLYLATPSLTREDIQIALAMELGLEIRDSARAAQVLRLLQDHLIQQYAEGKQVVVLIDEAHVMPHETLEEIRLLSNLESNRHKLLKIVLFGQPELNDILAQTHMRQLKERITHNFFLEPLISQDVAEYINFRLRAAGYRGPSLFSQSAIKLISEASMGLTRRINILADKSLLAAFAQSTHDIDPSIVRTAVNDCDFATPPSRNIRPGWRWAVAGVAVLIIGLAIGWFLREQDAGVVSPAVTSPSQTPPALAHGGAETTPTPPSAPPVKNAATALNHPLQAPATNPTGNTSPVSPPATPATPSLPVAPTQSTSIAPTVTPLAPLGPTTQARWLASQPWLQSAPDERWFIQLTATDIGNATQIENFLQRTDKSLPAEGTRIYLVNKGKTQKLGVIHGDFPSQQAAQAFLATLSPELKKSNPYPRPVRHLR